MVNASLEKTVKIFARIMETKPTIYVLAGANGIGKTSVNSLAQQPLTAYVYSVVCDQIITCILRGWKPNEITIEIFFSSLQQQTHKYRLK